MDLKHLAQYVHGVQEVVRVVDQYLDHRHVRDPVRVPDRVADQGKKRFNQNKPE